MPDTKETFPRDPRNEQTLLTELGEAKARCLKLQAFKVWVHAYLDTHGVPHHPPGPHGAEGCRIGDRMDWLMAKLANAEQAVDHIAAEDKAERDALGGHGERLRDWLALALANTYDMGMTTEDRRKLAAAEVFLKETAPPA